MSFALRLKELRTSKNMTQGELSKALNISQSAIAMYESGRREPKIEILEIFADYFNVDMNYITGKSNLTTKIESPTPPPNAIPLGTYPYKIPLLGRVAAGEPIYADERIEGYEFIEERYKDDGFDYFALHIQGRSMEPTIMDGDTVIVRQQSTVENGQIAIVLIDGEDATAKEVKEGPEGITLIGHNTSVYTPHHYTPREVMELPVRIIGKVIEIRRKIA